MGLTELKLWIYALDILYHNSDIFLYKVPRKTRLKKWASVTQAHGCYVGGLTGKRDRKCHSRDGLWNSAHCHVSSTHSDSSVSSLLLLWMLYSFIIGLNDIHRLHLESFTVFRYEILKCGTVLSVSLQYQQVRKATTRKIKILDRSGYL